MAMTLKPFSHFARLSALLGCALLMFAKADVAWSFIVLQGPLETDYDVDGNGASDAKAVSQFIQETSLLGIPQGSWAIQTWIQGGLIDYYDTNYNWGPSPNTPNMTGSLNGLGAIVRGLSSGTGGTTAVWSVASKGVPSANPAVNIAPTVSMQFAPLVFTVPPINRTVSNVTNWNYTPTRPDQAAYYVYANGATNIGGGAGGPNAPLRLAPLAVPGPYTPGQVFDTHASLEIVDLAASEIDQVLVDFVSTVEVDSTGSFIYTYQVTNLAEAPLDFDWEAAGFTGEQLEAAGGDDTRVRSFVSDLAPQEVVGMGDLVYHVFNGNLAAPAAGYVPTLVPSPVPAPAAVWLFGSGLAVLWPVVRRRVHARPSRRW
jgi:hypothetical protein